MLVVSRWIARVALSVALMLLGLVWLAPSAYAQVGDPKQIVSSERLPVCYFVNTSKGNTLCVATESGAAAAAAQLLTTPMTTSGSVRCATTYTVKSVPQGDGYVVFTVTGRCERLNPTTGQWESTTPPAPTEESYGLGKRVDWLQCPANANGRDEGGQMVCYCNSGFKSVGGVCLPDDCGARAGQVSRRNVTLGWSRTDNRSNSSAYNSMVAGAVKVGAGSSACDGKCAGSLFQDEKSSIWQSINANEQGMYRVSGDYEFIYTGAACTGTSPEMDPAAPAPACDGFLGQINGKATCVGKVGSGDTPLESKTPVKVGNPAAGSSPTDPGRTGGTGGSAGGPSGSKDGSLRGGTGNATDGSGGTVGTPGGTDGGTGTMPGEIELKTCGVPGEAPCKIDETGTPGQDAVESAKTANEIKLGTVMDNARTQLEQLSTGNGSRKSLPWSPSALLLPTGACAAQTTETRLGTLRFDPCSSSIALLFRDLMGWMYYMFTLLYAWRAASGGVGGGR